MFSLNEITRWHVARKQEEDTETECCDVASEHVLTGRSSSVLSSQTQGSCPSVGRAKTALKTILIRLHHRQRFAPEAASETDSRKSLA